MSDRHVRDLCDQWDGFSKGESDTTRQIRRALDLPDDCHAACALGRADHPGSREYRCIDEHGDTLPWPGEVSA